MRRVSKISKMTSFRPQYSLFSICILLGLGFLFVKHLSDYRRISASSSSLLDIRLYMFILLALIAVLWYTIWRHEKVACHFKGMADISPLYDFDCKNEKPLRVYYEPFLRSKKFALSMGLRKCTLNDFMVFDHNYPDRMKARRQIEAEHPEDTLKCLPIAEYAAAEALELIVQTLTKRYPTMFKRAQSSTNEKEEFVQNIVSGDTVLVGPRVVGVAALASISRLSEDDVVILQYNEEAKSYVATAAASTFPNGFSFTSKIGLTLSSQVICHINML